MRPWRDTPQLQQRLNRRKKNGWTGTHKLSHLSIAQPLKVPGISSPLCNPSEHHDVQKAPVTTHPLAPIPSIDNCRVRNWRARGSQLGSKSALCSQSSLQKREDVTVQSPLDEQYTQEIMAQSREGGRLHGSQTA